MKTFLFSITFAVALVLYSAGLFVPGTHGLENTDDGLVILDDAAMSQLVGGSIYKTNYLASPGNGATTPNCDVPVPDCDTTEVNISYDRWSCTPCNTRQGRVFKYTTNKKIIRERRTCKLISDGCLPRHHVDYRQYSCEVDQTKWCRP